LTFVLTKSLAVGTTDVNARESASRSALAAGLWVPSIAAQGLTCAFLLRATTGARTVSQAIEPMAIIILNPGPPPMITYGAEIIEVAHSGSAESPTSRPDPR
jgi:hypothetical protein